MSRELGPNRNSHGDFSSQAGPGARFYPLPAEGAGGPARSFGGVCEGTEWNYLHAERRRGTGENVGVPAISVIRVQVQQSYSIRNDLMNTMITTS